MIPLQDQEEIRELFETQLDGPVKIEFFTQRPAPVLIPGREECQFCEAIGDLLEDLARLSPKITLRVHELARAGEEAKRYGIERVPATVVRGVLNRPIVFYGFPAAELFGAFLEVLVAISSGRSTFPPALKKKLKRIKRDLPLQAFVAPGDPLSGDLVRVLAALAIEHGRLKLTVIEVGEFPALVEAAGVEQVPQTSIDGRTLIAGLPPPDALLDELVKAAEAPVLAGPARLPGGGVALDLPKAGERPRGEVRPSGLIIPGR
jgi:alkyl hydroperoxide reductase subunit AhpF